jgi:hypothetical protein
VPGTRTVGGYQPPTQPTERRAFFDLLRRIAKMEEEGSGTVGPPGPAGALGVVAVGTMVVGSPISGGPAGTQNLTNPIVITLTTGRRYRIAFAARAWGLSSPGNAQIRLSLNPSTPYGERYVYSSGPWEGLAQEWYINGDGASHSLVIVFNNHGGSTCNIFTDEVSPTTGANFFIVEDVGPS